MRSGQTAGPEWFPTLDGFWEGMSLEGGFVKVVVRERGAVDEPELSVEVIPERNLNLRSDMLDEIYDNLITLFTLKYNMNSFYAKFRGDVIAEIFPKVRGLRLMQGIVPFKSLICSILSQNASVRQWNRWARRISELLSKHLKFSDGTIYHPFPDPKMFTSIDRRILENCGVGYRARYLVEASSEVEDGSLNLSRLRGMSYVEARARLMKIQGVGPKVADCFLLYGLGMRGAAPVDLWIHRIASKLYFNGARVSKEEVGRFLRGRYGSNAGLVQLYLYHYGRTLWKDEIRRDTSSKLFK